MTTMQWEHKSWNFKDENRTASNPNQQLLLVQEMIGHVLPHVGQRRISHRTNPKQQLLLVQEIIAHVLPHVDQNFLITQQYRFIGCCIKVGILQQKMSKTKISSIPNQQLLLVQGMIAHVLPHVGQRRKTHSYQSKATHVTCTGNDCTRVATCQSKFLISEQYRFTSC